MRADARHGTATSIGRMMGEWKPKHRLADDPAAREDLDRHVRGIDWTDRAVEFGSRERMLAAAWMQQTDLVEGEMRRLYPVEEQRDTMTRWVTVRVFEKITGVPVESKSTQWNWNGLWDPTEPTSFCGWVRRISLPLAQWNAKRVLKTRTPSASAFETEDGHNPVYDDASSTSVAGGSMASAPFERDPTLRVPRPVGRIREQMMRAVTDGTCEDAIRIARDAGLWDHTLDRLDANTVCMLMLAPIPQDMAPLLEHDPHPWTGMHDAVRLYWPTQTSRRRVWQPDLKRAVQRVAAANDVTEFDVIRELGTMAARLISD